MSSCDQTAVILQHKAPGRADVLHTGALSKGEQGVYSVFFMSIFTYGKKKNKTKRGFICFVINLSCYLVLVLLYKL